MSASAARSLAWNAAMTAHSGERDLHIPSSAIEGQIPPPLFGGRHLQNGPGWTKVGAWSAAGGTVSGDAMGGKAMLIIAGSTTGRLTVSTSMRIWFVINPLC